MDSLLLVHGYLGGGAQWVDQSAAFSDRFRVFTPDLPGFGEDNKSTAPEQIEDYATFLLDKISGEGVTRFHLVGHSMGGMIAQEMVRLAPERIDRLVFYGTGPVGSLPGRFEPIAESKRRAVEDGVEATGRRIAATWFKEGERAEGFSVCAKLAARASLQATLAGLTAMDSWSGRTGLQHIKSRTLVLWGDGDRTYPWEQPESLWKEIPNSLLAAVPGCAHAVHLEKPGLFNAILLDFLGAG